MVGYGDIIGTLESIRRKSVPKIPATLAELATELDTQKCLKFATVKRDKSKKFYQGFFSNSDVDAIFFSDPDLLDCLAHAKQVHIDATFKALPRKPKAYQLFSIHFRQGEHVCFLENL
jgi:hypothetical protein